MLVTFAVLKFFRSRVFRFLHSANMMLISVTFWVSNLLTSIDEMGQQWNMCDIVVTLEVMKLLMLILLSLKQ
jgi:hypothetical protein